MSFILDALKKSELERQRQSVPGLMDTRTLQRRNRLPVWAVALCVLLTVNLLVLTFVLTRRSVPALPAAPAPLAATAQPVAAAPQQHFSPMDAAPVFAPEIPVADNPNPAPAEPPQAHSAPHLARPDPLLTEQEAKPEDLESLPTINELNLTGAQALPELHLDVHVYSTNPAERFVYINMRKYHEAARLQEGPTVERIRRDGVVLNYQGLRFVLPRQ
ncbi:MAG TPA: general secretion pathway protein GspB [Steroidobacteraceae bacterium]|jgi:general secretion pathway protein B